MKTTSKGKKTSESGLSATRVPIYHRRRRDWRDDQYLIDEIAGNICGKSGDKHNSVKAIKAFKKLVQEIEQTGFQSNQLAFSLAMWIREQLANLASKNGGYDLRLHSIKIPIGISQVISKRSNIFTEFKSGLSKDISLQDLFPDPAVSSYVLERVQLLHKGDLLSYLNSLVCKERESLTGESATILDLINICKEKLKRRNLKIVSNFNANEADLWVPGLRLGIEIRDTLSGNENQELIEVLKNTNSSRKTRFLVVICPDELSDLIFHNWRKMVQSEQLPNLSVIRAGDFGSYLDNLSTLLEND